MTEWLRGNLKTNGINMQFHRTGGEKPSLLLLHGITDDGLCWTRIARDLQNHYDIVMADARGHGGSDGISTGFSVPILADDAAGLIAALGLKESIVFGHSMGAITAATLAANYPKLVKAVVLEDPPLEENPPPPPAGFAEQFRKDILELKAMSSRERMAKIAAQHPGWHELEIGPSADAKAVVDMAAVGRIEIFRNYPWREVFARIPCPGLLLTGDPVAGAIVTPKAARQAALLWKGAEVVRIPGAGHCIHRDRYEETMQAVNDFLNRQ